MPNKERIRTITLRKFYLLSGNYCGSVKSHKIHDQFLLLDFSINKGEIEIEIENLTTNIILKFTNSNAGIHEIKLDKNTKYAFRIFSRKASGFYSIKVKTIKKEDNSIIY